LSSCDSSYVKGAVTPPPAPDGAEALRVPEYTVITFAPMFEIRLVIEDCAPVPTDSSATTDPTPMIMPNIVNAERSLFAIKARKALRKFCEKLSLMVSPFLLLIPRYSFARRNK
jgi:hypothetical protein